MRDHLFKWFKRWKREQRRLWVDRQEGEDGYKGVEKVLKKPKNRLLISPVFAEENYLRAVLDFLSGTDVGRISGVVEEVYSDHVESSDGRVKVHQQKIIPSGRDGSVRVDAVRQSHQRHPGGGLLRARCQYHASRCISPSHHSFTFSSCSVGLLF